MPSFIAIFKANPYRDEEGKFTTAGMATSFSLSHSDGGTIGGSRIDASSHTKAADSIQAIMGKRGVERISTSVGEVITRTSTGYDPKLHDVRNEVEASLVNQGYRMKEIGTWNKGTSYEAKDGSHEVEVALKVRPQGTKMANALEVRTRPTGTGGVTRQQRLLNLGAKA